MGMMKALAGLKLSGDKVIARKFTRTANKLTSNQIAIVALNAGAAVIRDAAVALAPKDSGLLAKSIKIRPAKQKHKDTRLVTLGPTHKKSFVRRTDKGTLRGVSKGKVAEYRAKGVEVMPYDPGNYGHLVEFGTAPHGPKNRKVMRLAGGRFARWVKGVRPHPFMRPAFDAKAGAAGRRAEEKLKQLIKAEMRK